MFQQPSADEVHSYIDGLSNWGRWGSDDQAGTLNLIAPEHRVAAARLVTEGRTVSCSRDLVTGYGRPDNCAQMYYVASGEGATPADPSIPATSFGSGDLGSAVEYVGLVYHGFNVTHIDSLAHIFWKGKIYNDRPAGLTTAEHGALWGSVMEMKSGIVGRGVLLDVARAEGVDALEPGRAVSPDDLQATAAKQGVVVGDGDIVLLRTGRWHASSQARGPSSPAGGGAGSPGHMAGWHPACMPWLHERSVSLIGADGPQEVMPGPYPHGEGANVHILALYSMGMPLIDNCDLEELGETCAELGRWEFQFMVSPLRVAGGSGSPVNPIAVF